MPLEQYKKIILGLLAASCFIICVFTASCVFKQRRINAPTVIYKEDEEPKYSKRNPRETIKKRKMNLSVQDENMPEYIAYDPDINARTKFDLAIES